MDISVQIFVVKSRKCCVGGRKHPTPLVTAEQLKQGVPRSFFVNAVIGW